MTSGEGVRESFGRFPWWTQHFWTWLTGKALPNQRPLVRLTWWGYLAATLVGFFAGLALSTFALVRADGPDWLLLVLGWAFTLASGRCMILVIAHQCIHKRFSRNRRMDLFVGELVTVLTVYQDAHAFKVEHFDAHHRRGTFATHNDPPVQYLMDLGFKPGMSRRQLWFRAIVVFLSPFFYLQGFYERLKANLTSGTWRRVGFGLWAGFWLGMPLWLDNGAQVLLMAFVVPVIPMAQLSALLDKLGEHAWLTPPDPNHSPQHEHVSASWARFSGAELPKKSLALHKKPFAWLLWGASMLLYHLPSRLFVVVGDLPNHDFHHRFPSTPDWMVAAYARQRDIDNLPADHPPYSEVWGMFQAVDRTFESLSKAQPLHERSSVSAAEPSTHVS